MSLTDLIEKLINEHESFKEHLELLREQTSILEKENSALKKEHGSFKEHLEPLREQISILERENSALKKEHGSFKEHLEPLKEQISILERENSALKKEHGSFREHLEPLKEQISILEEENSALKSEKAALKSREDTMVSKPSKATREVERRDDALKVPKKAPEEPRLDAVTKKILKLFFDTGQELSVNQAAGKLSINISTVQYHFDLLSEAKLIVQTNEGDKSSRKGETTPALFELSYSGRKYVIENKMVT